MYKNKKEILIKKIINSEPKISNVVCTLELNKILDLRKIALKTKNSEYNPKRFHALILRLRDPRTTAMIFKSGKIVCTGAKDEKLCRKAGKKIVSLIKGAGFYELKIKNFSVRNIVGVTNLKTPIRLDSLVYAYRKECMYEPEVFPGVIMKPTKTKAVAMVFTTGRVVITGAKSVEEIKKINNKIIKMILEVKSFLFLKDKD